MGLMFAGQTNGPGPGARPWPLSCRPPAAGGLVLFTAVLVYFEFSRKATDVPCLGPSLCPRGRLCAAVTFGLTGDR